jgi:ATP-dependent DNA helicase RecG
MPRLPIKGLEKEKINKINEDLLNKCNTMVPRYIPDVEHTQYNGKEILVIWVRGGNDRPYKCPVHFHKEGEKKRYEMDYYIRKMSSTIRANENDLKELFSVASDIPFDDRINWNAGMTDLRRPLMRDHLCEVGSALCEHAEDMSVSTLAEAMRMAAGPRENMRPLNAGLMFFNDRPDNFFRYARIEVVDKPDPTGEGMMEKTFTGPLDWQLRNALAFIKNYVIKEKIFKHSDRPEADRFFNYPFEAIEEILTNAVFHKSYQIPEPITVVFTPEKMEITSCPGPDRSISDDDLKDCILVSKQTRNRRIGDMLKELKLAEGRNTGIPKILRSIKRNGNRMPVFETDAERSYLSVSIPIHRVFKGEVLKRTIYVDTISYKTLRSPRPYRNKSALKEEILKILKKEDTSRSKLVDMLGYTKLTDGLREAISELMSEGRIEHTIPDNLTNKGQRLRISRP